MIDISIVILTKNAGRGFKQVLQSVQKQKVNQKFEIIIIDSGSTDETLEIVKEFKIEKILRIDPKDFDFHQTKKLALNLAEGKYIVFLSQDALPKNEYWLKNLIQPLQEKNIGATFSRQIPYSNSNLYQKYSVSFIYPEKETNKLLGRIFFSNVSSAIKREILEKIEISEKIPMCEDQVWARQIVNYGYQVIYVPDSVVYHSHHYNFWDNFKKNFDYGLSLKKTNINRSLSWRYSFIYIIKELLFLFREKKIFFVFYLPSLIIYESFRVLGFWLGLHYRYLPLFLRKKFSLFKRNLE